MTGNNPTDRSKLGTKRHILTDKKGIPLSVVISSASTHDIKLVTDVIDSAVIKQRPSSSSSVPILGIRRGRRGKKLQQSNQTQQSNQSKQQQDPQMNEKLLNYTNAAILALNDDNTGAAQDNLVQIQNELINASGNQVVVIPAPAISADESDGESD